MDSPYDSRDMNGAHRAFTQKNERRGLDNRVKILNGVLKTSRGFVFINLRRRADC